MNTFKTAAEVFEDAQEQSGKAIAAFLLNPCQKTEQEMKHAQSALSQAAKFAEKNLAQNELAEIP